MFKKEKTNRGFDLLTFKDDYDSQCSVQISSSVEPHIWLGISKPRMSIMKKDADRLGIETEKRHPETNEYGWCDFSVPKEVLVESRMHLNKEQAKQLAKKLLFFAYSGHI